MSDLDPASARGRGPVRAFGPPKALTNPAVVIVLAVAFGGTFAVATSRTHEWVLGVTASLTAAMVFPYLKAAVRRRGR